MHHKKSTKLLTAILMAFLCTVAYSADSAKKATKPPSDKAQDITIDQQNFSDAINAYNAKDYEKAIKLLQPLAEKGHASAQGVLGMIYHTGSGVEVNVKEAKHWYELAYKSGRRGTIANNLGLIYRDGYDGVKDTKKAEQLFIEAGGDDKYALGNLAELYLRYPNFFNEENLRKGLQLAQKAVDLGKDETKLLSTIECALNANAHIRNTWDNAQSLYAFDLKGKVMNAKYNDITKSGVLVFGKSGQLINAVINDSSTEYNYAYSYDKACNLIGEVRTSINDRGAKKTHNAIDSMYLNGRLDYQRAFDGSRRFTYQEPPDGTLFTTIETAFKSNTNTGYRHSDRNGRPIWSSDNEWPANGIAHNFFNGLVHFGVGGDYPSAINKDSSGRIFYDKGYYYAYASNGKLAKVIDRAGRNGEIRGALSFEYDENNFLKRENSHDEMTGQNKDYNYANYQKDSNGNWTKRTESFTYEGKVVSIDNSREIKYW